MEADSRPYGRRAFLGLVFAGTSSLVWGRAAWSHVAGATQILPFVPGWRTYTVAATMPRFDPATWRLTIDGLVEQPTTLSYADLLALPQADQTSDFHCVTGWSVDNVRWRGVRFADLLAVAKPLPTAKAITFTSAEIPYVETLTLPQALLPDALLAHSMDGKPMPRNHGAPARVVMPRMYGYKGTKWVERITLVDDPPYGYWEQRGYDRDARIGGTPRV
ncbi:MAG: molybdopterin-dependent oxidoreductase [Gaiellaceae bacterium]